MEKISRRTTSSAKSRSACSASRTFLKSFSSRKNASWSSVWPTIPPAAGEQQARLAEQVERDVGDRGLLFKLGQPGHPLLQAVAVDQRVVAEREAVADESARVEAVGHRRVDAFERVGEPGAERPAVTRVVVLDRRSYGLSSSGPKPGSPALVPPVLMFPVLTSPVPYICGTSSGMS